MSRLHRRITPIVLVLASSLSLRADWTAVTSPTTEDLWGLCYGANQFVATGRAGTILTSLNGATWTARNSGTTEWLTAIAYSADQHLYVAVGDHGTILTSPDTLVWTPRTSGTTQRLNNILYAAGRWLAVGEAGTVCTSTDAIAWTVTILPLDTWLRGLCYGPDSFLIGAGDGTLCSTTDGQHFRYLGQPANPEDLDYSPLNVTSSEALVYGQGVLATTGINSAVFLSDSTLQQWSPRLRGTDGNLRGLAVTGNSICAVGDSGRLVSIYVGPFANRTLPSITSLGTHNLNAVAAGSDRTVIVGDQSAIYLNLSSPSPQIAPVNAQIRVTPETLYLGGTARLQVDVTGAEPLSYQWSRNGSPIPGETTNALRLRHLTAADTAASYQVVVTNRLGSTTAASTLPSAALAPSASVDADFTPGPFFPSSLAVTPLAGGKMLLGSDRLARLNLEGTWDLGFRAAARGAVTMLPDGRLLVYDRLSTPRRLTRLLADGSLDPTFSTDADHGTPIPLNDGRIVCVASDAASGTTTITRLRSDGSLDDTFGTPPLVFSPAALYACSTIDDLGRVYLVFNQPDSTPVTTGSRSGWLVRLTPQGTIDGSFPLTQLDETIAEIHWIAGRLCYRHVTPSSPPWLWHSYAKLTADGQPDPSFPRFAFGPEPPSLILTSVATFDREGGLIVSSYSNASAGIIRYDPAGRVDPAFSSRLALPFAQIASLTLLADGSLVAAGKFDYLNGVPTAGLARIVPTTDAYATRLSNLSILTTAGGDDATLMAGFIVGGTAGTRDVLIRGVGPGLADVGVQPALALADPQIKLHRDSTAIATNDNWPADLASTATALGAFPLQPGSVDAALVANLSPGNHSVHLTAALGASTGLALVEVYDAGPTPTSSEAPRLRNLSGRAALGSASDTLAAGFVIDGHATKRILIRAVGPSLVFHGVNDALPNPTLALYQSGVAAPIATNDDWAFSAESTFRVVGAFGLPTGSRDAALVVDLPPGVYSAVVRSADGQSGVALVEIYEVP